MLILNRNGFLFLTFDSFLVPNPFVSIVFFTVNKKVLCTYQGFGEKSQSSDACGLTNLL